jgi:O-antigen ligase
MAMAIYALTALAIGSDVIVSFSRAQPSFARRRREPHPPRISQVFKNPLFLVCLAFVALLGLQLLPWPEGVIQLLSPKAHALRETVQQITGQSSQFWPISLIPYNTKIGLLKVLAYILALALILTVAGTRSRMKSLAIVFVALGLFQVLYGVAQTYSLDQGHIWWWPKEYYQDSVTGTYINRNHLAGFLELAIPLCLGLSFYGWLKRRPASGRRGERRELSGEKKKVTRSERQVVSEEPQDQISESREQKAGKDEKRKVVVKKRIANHHSSASQNKSLGQRIKQWILSQEKMALPWLFMFFAVIMGVGLLLTSSRGGVLSLAGAMLLIAFLLFLRPGYRQLGGGIICIGLAVVVYGTIVGLDRTAQRFEQIEGGWSGRVNIWAHARPMVWDYPVLGTGLGTFQDAYYAYAPPEHSGRTTWNYAHNDWLQVAIETGLVGFGIVFAGYIWFLTVAIRQWFGRRDPLAVGIGGGMIMALCSIGIHSLVDFNMHIPANALSTMVVAGLGWNALFVRTR